MNQSKMKALVYEGPKVMNVREVAVPTLQADEVLIKVERVGICGLELGGYLGHNSLRKPPLIMGHEFSGVVAEVGTAVNTFSDGDRVAVNPLVTCGVCRYCKYGEPQLCLSRSLLGAHRPGAFADYVAVPISNVYKLEAHVSFDEAALTEPYAVAVHICRLLQLTTGDRLLIIGAGPIGIFTLQAAQSYGLHHITVVDTSPERLEIVTEIGGAAVTSLDEANIGTYDAAVDAVGLDITRTQCVEYVRPGGSIVFSGLHQNSSELPINTAIRNEIKMYGAFSNTPEDFEIALQWITEGKIRMLDWTEYAPLADGAACFDKLITGPGKVAKIMLQL